MRRDARRHGQLQQGTQPGASTITMQVARNVYLLVRKDLHAQDLRVMLAFKLERTLTRTRSSKIYMNQIFLGNRAYGFAAASEAYRQAAAADQT